MATRLFRWMPVRSISNRTYKCAFAARILNDNFMLRVEHVTTAKQAA